MIENHNLGNIGFVFAIVALIASVESLVCPIEEFKAET
jgi:hypothetical protein